MSDAQIRHERDLLGQALGGLLVALGVVSDVGMTGPELLAHVATATSEGPARDAVVSAAIERRKAHDAFGALDMSDDAAIDAAEGRMDAAEVAYEAAVDALLRLRGGSE